MVLIRHAESAPNRDLAEADWPLSSRGREQAESLAGELSGAGIAEVYSSPYLRAVDSVRRLADRIGVSVDLRSELRERKLREGLRDDWRELLKRAWADFTFALPNCESGFECQTRMRDCLARLAQEQSGCTIAVCSHGNAIGLFLNSIDSQFGFTQWSQMKNPDLFWIEWRDGDPEWVRGQQA